MPSKAFTMLVLLGHQAQKQPVCSTGVKSQKTDQDDSDDWDDDEDNDDGFTSELLGLGKHPSWLKSYILPC